MDELFIEPEQLKTWDGLIIDTRMPQRYAAGHIPGAVNLPMISIRQQHGSATLVADAGDFSNQVSAAGIGQETPLVLYSERGQPDAGYMMWALHYHGHHGARLLNGGVEAWVSQSAALVKEASLVEARPFIGILDDARRVDREWMMAHLEEEGVCLLDNRTHEEYTGEDVLAQQGGHIPSAHWLPWEALLESDLTLKPKTQLRQLFEQAGLRPDHTAVVYCQTGNRSGLVYVGLRLIGHVDVRMYDGSWGQWGNELDLPTEIGERRKSMPIEQLDLRGEICPFTLINTKKKVSQLALGTLLEVLVDNVDATETIPNWSRNAGHQVEGVDDLSEGGWRIRIQIKGTSN